MVPKLHNYCWLYMIAFQVLFMPFVAFDLTTIAIYRFLNSQSHHLYIFFLLIDDMPAMIMIENKPF